MICALGRYITINLKKIKFKTKTWVLYSKIIRYQDILVGRYFYTKKKNKH